MTEAEEKGKSVPARPLGRLAASAVLVLLLGFGMAWGGRSIEKRQQAGQEASTAATGPRLRTVSREEAPTNLPAPSNARSAENGDFEVVARGRETGWQREAPRPPLGPSSLVSLKPEQPPAAIAPPAPDPGTPRATLLFGPVATAAGRLEVAGHVIEVEGVRIVDPAQQCDGQGRSWPCGAVARAAFRAWLRNRAVECVVTPLPLPKPVSSLCRLGGKDVAEWLVAKGYAEAAAGGAYEQAGQEARAARRGIFGAGPAALPPSEIAPAVAQDAEAGVSSAQSEGSQAETSAVTLTQQP